MSKVIDSSNDIVSQITNAYGNPTSIFYIVAPVVIAGWAFTTLLNYPTDNESHHNGIKDILEKRAFNKLIIPLYEAITGNLIEGGALRGLGSSSKNVAKTINDYEAKKIELLKARDFTFIEESDSFQKTITDLIVNKKNVMELKDLIKRSRLILFFTLILSAMCVLSGVLIVLFQSILYMPEFSLLSLIFWISSLVMSLILAGSYLINETLINNLKND